MSTIARRTVPIACVVMTACSSGNGTPIPGVTGSDYPGYEAELSTLEAAFAASTIANFGDLPTNGQGTYTGVAALGPGDGGIPTTVDPAYLMRALIEIDFGSGDGTGALTDIHDQSNNPVAGEFLIDGSINGTGAFIADVSGTAEIGGSSGSWSGDLGGRFLNAGATAQGLGGEWGLDQDADGFFEWSGFFLTQQ